MGWDSSVGIATGWSGDRAPEGRDFLHPSRQACHHYVVFTVRFEMSQPAASIIGCAAGKSHGE